MTETDRQLDSNAQASGPQFGEPVRPNHAMRILTFRQLDVLCELAKGQSNKEIGKALTLSPETVNHHLKAIFSKLGVRTRADAVGAARRRAIIS